MNKSIKSILIIFSVTIALGLSACGGGGGSTPPPPASDTSPPVVESTIPESEKLNVGIGDFIYVIFNEPVAAVNSSHVNVAAFKTDGSLDVRVKFKANSFALTNGGKTVEIRTVDLLTDTKYQVDIHNVKNSSGIIMLASCKWQFATGIYPKFGVGKTGVCATDPVNAPTPDATVKPVSLSIIKSNIPVVITYSERMDPTSISLGGTMLNDGGVWSATNVSDDTLTIKPLSTWTEGVRKLTVNASSILGVKSALLDLQYTVDITKPTATPVPASGAAIQKNTVIEISFSESIDTSLFTASGTLWDEAKQGNTLWSNKTNPNDTLTLTPVKIWVDGSKNLNIDAPDIAGNHLTKQFSYIVDTQLPNVTAIVPQSTSTLNLTAIVKIVFSESMDIGSLKGSGSLWDESNKGVWSTTTNANDTLTFNPTTQWSKSNKILILDVNDLFMNPLVTLNLSYGVGCSTGLTTCAGSCVDLTSDNNNCNTCGSTCNSAVNSSNQCIASSCKLTCNSGFGDCNQNPVDGCETPTSGDKNNCGACGSICVDSQPAYGTCTQKNPATICSTVGTQTKTVYPSVCSAGACSVSTTPIITTVPCTVNKDGQTCAKSTAPVYGTCTQKNPATICSTVGTQTKTVYPSVCSAGACSVSTTPIVTTVPCTVQRAGVTCATSNGPVLGTCGGFTSTCDTTGTRTLTVTNYTCNQSTATCTGKPTVSSVVCSRNTDGRACSGFGICRGGVCKSTIFPKCFPRCTTGQVCCPVGTNSTCVRGIACL